MGAARQFGALLWKNYIARKRHPVLFCLEILFPIVIFLAVGLMRRALPPTERSSCSYKERSLPSAGLVPFLQSSICALDNPCVNETAVPEMAARQQQFRSLIADLGPTLEKPKVVAAMKALPTVAKVYTVLKDTQDRVNITKLDDMFKIRNMVKDPAVVHDILVKKYKVLTPDSANALLDSSLNAVELLGLSAIDWKGIVCDPALLQKYVYFRKEVDVARVSQSLCDIRDDDISAIVNDLIRQLDINNVLQIARDLARLSGEIDLGLLFEDLGGLVEMFLGESRLLASMDLLMDFKDLPEMMMRMTELVPLMTNMGELDWSSFGAMYEIVKPMLSLFMEDTEFLDGLDPLFSSNMTEIFKDPANMDLEELMRQLAPLTESLNMVPNTMSTMTLEAPSAELEIIITELMTNGRVENDTAVNRTLDYMEGMMLQIMGPDMMNMVMYMTVNMMDSMQEMSEWTAGLHDQVVYHVATSPAMATAIDRVTQLGPDTATAFLEEAIRTENIYGMITNELDGSTLCDRTMYRTLGDLPETERLEFGNTVCQPVVTQAIDAMFSVNESYAEMQDKMVERMNEMDVRLQTGDYPTTDLHMTDMYYRVMDMMETVAMPSPVSDELDVVLYTSADNDTWSQWYTVWINMNEQFDVNSNMLLIAPMAGEAMEKSTMWNSTMMAPVTMGHAIFEAVMSRADKLNAMAMDQTIMAQMIEYLPYLPEFISSFFRQIDTQQLMLSASGNTTEDLVMLLCDCMDWHQLNLSQHIPVTEMKELVCTKDWETFIQNLVMVFEPMAMVEEVEAVYMDSIDQGVNWMDAAANIQSLTDSLRGGAFQTLLSGAYVDLDSWWSALTTVGDTLARSTMQSVTGDNLRLSSSLLVSVDHMLGAVPLWNRVRHYAQLWIYYEKSLEEYEQLAQAPGFNKTTYLQQQSPTLAALYDDVAKLFPTSKDLMKLENVGVMTEFVTGNWTELCSESNPSSNTAMLIELMCNTDWEAITMELETSGSYLATYMKQLELVMQPTEWLPPISINWTDLLTSTERMMSRPVDQLLEHSVLGLWDAESIMDEFGKIMAELNNSDISSLMSMADALNFGLLMGSDTSSMFVDYMKSELYLNYEIIQFLIKQLEYFNSTDVVDLKVYMNSVEAHKLLDVFARSPDLPPVVVETLKSAIFNNKLATVQLEAICNASSSAFSELVEIPAGTSMTASEIQELVCGAHIDFVKMMEELRYGMVGLDELITAIENFGAYMMTGNSTTGDHRDFAVTYEEYMSATPLYTKLLEDIISSPPDFVITATPVEEHLNNLMSVVESQLAGLMSEFNSTDMLTNMLTQMSPGLGISMLESIVEMDTIWTVASLYVDSLHNMINLGEVLMMEPGARTGKYPEMQKVWEMMDWFPEIFYTYTYTSVNDEPKVAYFTALLINGTEALCMADPADLMTVPPDSDFDFGVVLGIFCSIDMAALGQEMQAISDMQAISQAYAGNSSTGADVVSLQTDIESLITKVTEFMNASSTWYMPRFLNMTLWNSNMESVLQLYMPVSNSTEEAAQSVEQSLGQLQQQLVSLQSASPEIGAMLQVAHMYMKVMDRMVAIMQGTFLEEDATLDSYTNVRIVWTLMQELPHVAQTLIYTAVVDNDKIMKVLELLSNGTDVLCAEPPDTLMTVPPNSNFSFTEFFTKFCSIDMEALVQESLDMTTMDLGGLFMPVDLSNSSTVNVTAMFADVEGLMADVTDIFTRLSTLQLPAFLDEAAWAGVADLPITWDTANLVQVPAYADVLESMLGNDTSIGKMLATLNVALEEVIRQSQESGSSLNVSDVVSMLESLQRLATQMDKAMNSDDIDMNTLEMLLEDPDQITSLCASGSLAERITTPGHSQDLGQAFQEVICLSPGDLVNNLEIQRKIMDIWSGNANPEMYSLRANLEKMGDLVAQLSGTDLGNMTDIVAWLDTNLFMSFVEPAFSDPKLILGLLRVYQFDLGEANGAVSMIAIFSAQVGQRLKAISDDPSLSDAVKLLRMLKIVSNGDEWMKMLLKAEFELLISKVATNPILLDAVCNVTDLEFYNDMYGPGARSMYQVSLILCGVNPTLWYEMLIYNSFNLEEMYLLKNIIQGITGVTNEASWEEMVDKMSEATDSISGIDWGSMVANLTEQELMDLLTTAGSPQNVGPLLQLLQVDASANIQVLELVSQYLALLNTDKGLLTLAGLPSMQPFIDVFDGLLSNQENLAALMLAIVDPIPYWTTLLEGSWESVVCDWSTFTETFTFPEGTDIAAIQRDLCASADKMPNFQDFLQTEGTEEIMAKIEEVLSGQSTSNHTVESIMTLISEQVTGIVESNTLSMENLLLVLANWLDPVALYINSSDTSVLTNTDGLLSGCDMMVGYIQGTDMYRDVLQPMLDSYLVQIQISIEMMQVMMDAHSLACLSDKEIVQILQDMRNSPIPSELKTIAELITSAGSSVSFTCSGMADAYGTYTQLTEYAMTTLLDDNNNVFTCIGELLMKSGAVLEDMSKLESLSAEMSALLQDPQMKEFVEVLGGSTDAAAMFQEFVNVYIQQQQAQASLQALLTQNMTNIMEILQNSYDLGREQVAAFIKGATDLQLDKLTAEQLIDQVCDDGVLDDQFGTDSVYGDTLSDLREPLCGDDRQAATEAANYILEASKVLTGLQDLEGDDVLGSLSGDISALLRDIEGVSDLALYVERLGSLDMAAINGSTLSTLQRLLLDRGPDRLLESLNSLLDNFATDETSSNFVEDAKMLAKGVTAFRSLRHIFMANVQIQDLVKDAEELRRYLINSVDLPPQVATAIVEGSLSFEMLLEASQMDLTEWICDPEKLAALIKDEDETGLNVTHVSHQFCSLNSSTVAAMLEDILNQLDVGDFLEEMIVNGIGSMLREANTTLEDTKTALIDVQVASDDLKDVFTEVEQYLDNVPNAAEALTNQRSGNLNYKALSEMICGDPVEEIDDAVDFGRYTVKRPELTPGQKQEMMELPGKLVIGKGKRCQDLYADIMSVGVGPIIWGYLKPLLRGKILFAPNTPLVRDIITQVNTTFDSLQEVFTLSRDWADGVVSLKDLLANNGSAEIQEMFNSTLVQNILESLSGESSGSLEDLVYTLSDMEDGVVSGLVNVVKWAADYIECIELDRFHAYDTEAEMEAAASKLHDSSSLLAGIVFTNVPDTTSRGKRQASTNLPPHVEYKIRMNIDNVMATRRIKERMWRPQPEDQFTVELRYFRGFIQLQDMVDTAIVMLQTGGRVTPPSVTTQQFPFPCYIYDIFVNAFGGYGLPLVMTIAWIIIISVAVNHLVYDREAGQEETLKAMGMVSVLNWWAWFLTTIVIVAVMDLLVTVIIRTMDIFIYSNFAILYLYILVFLFSTLMLSYFVSAFFTRPAMAILACLIVYILSYLPYVIIITRETEMTFWQKSLTCLSSTTAFSFSAIFIARYEETQIGLQWDNIAESPIHGEDFTFSWGCIMMLIDAIIYLILGYYVRNVKPGKYGLSQPWYFIVCPSFWCGVGSSSKETRYQPQDQEAFVEPPTGDTPVVMTVRGLVKEFKKGERAVDNLSLDIRGNSVTTLLGHNGAAKTTTMKMLIGQLEPTSGEITVFGRPVSKMRESLGICPQHNSLYEYMTVHEHMQFYASMKSNKKSLSDKEEIEKLLMDVGLWNCRYQRVKELSGGMQRRLCVALAFVGGSKLVILDEPTSGVDPSGRRAIWNLILRQKYDVAVLLSTHHLDEADMISDQVIIMHEGRVLSQGSPIFLKHNFSTGHRLTVIKDDDSDTDPGKILERLRSWVPEVRIQQVYGHEMQFVLPPLRIGTFYDLFVDLEQHKRDLNITSYGVSDPTLEEVFMKVCSVADAGVKNVTPDTVRDTVSEQSMHARNGTDPAYKEKLDGSASSLNSTKRFEVDQGGSRFFSQFLALLAKRFHHFRRDYRMLIVVLFLPLVLFLAASGFYTIKPNTTEAPSLLLTPSLYGPDTHVFYKMETSKPLANNIVDSFMHNPGIGTTCMQGMDFGSPFECVNPDMRFTEESRVKINASCRCDNYKYTCDAEPAINHPRHMVTTTTDILQDLGGKDVDEYLLQSFYSYIEKRYGGLVFDDSADPSGSSDIEASIWYNNKGHHAMPSLYNAYSNGLLRSVVSGNPAEYGITTYNHPFLFDKEQIGEDTMLQSFADMGVAFCIVVAFTFIPSGALIYIVMETACRDKQLQMISGVGPVLYWISSLIWDMFLYAIGVGIAVIIMAIFKQDAFWANENLEGVVVLMFLFGWACLCLMYCFSKCFKDVATAFFVMFCTLIIVGIIAALILTTLEFFANNSEHLDRTFKALGGIFMVVPTYAFGSGLMKLITNQVRTEIFARFNADVYVSPFSLDMIGWHMIALAIEGFVFLVLTILLDIRCRRSRTYRFDNPFSDEEDVAKESRRIEQGHSVDDVVLVNNLHKVFKGSESDNHAVNGLSFGVQVGECFGLLGVNGAGKTTTFNILTGILDSTEGEAIIMGKRKYNGLSQLGYCPQEDALDPYLSIAEMLHFHCRLKGIASSKREMAVDHVMEKLQLLNIQKKLVKNCSGGMKRKLCLAIALLGNPEVVLLDEPTTGMDPKAKRLVWDYLLSAKEQGMSVILTSHSMEECDILCDRIGIMVNGRFKCLGSSQHLKEKYGSGYTIKLSFSGLSTTNNMIQELIDNFFPSARIREYHQSVLQLDVPRDAYRLTDLLHILEQEKDRYNIVYYTVAQTTLDTVFLNFAREQTDSGPEDSSTTGSTYSLRENSSVNLVPKSDKPGGLDSQHTYDNKVMSDAGMGGAYKPKEEGSYSKPFAQPVAAPEHVYPQLSLEPSDETQYGESTRL